MTETTEPGGSDAAPEPAAVPDRMPAGGQSIVARGRGVAEVGMHESVLDAGLIARFRAAGLGVGTWGANHEPSIRRMLDLGVDIFATDDPPLAIRLRAQR